MPNKQRLVGRHMKSEIDDVGRSCKVNFSFELEDYTSYVIEPENWIKSIKAQS